VGNPLIFNDRMNDGSRHFGTLPQTVLWYDLRDHVAKLSGATVTCFVTEHVTEAWIDFSFQGHEFAINDQLGEYWFFVQDPQCPDPVLKDVLAHFQHLLGE
jgi:hypothetical protein